MILNSPHSLDHFAETEEPSQAARIKNHVYFPRTLLLLHPIIRRYQETHCTFSVYSSQPRVRLKNDEIPLVLCKKRRAKVEGLNHGASLKRRKLPFSFHDAFYLPFKPPSSLLFIHYESRCATQTLIVSVSPFCLVSRFL